MTKKRLSDLLREEAQRSNETIPPVDPAPSETIPTRPETTPKGTVAKAASSAEVIGSAQAAGVAKVTEITEATEITEVTEAKEKLELESESISDEGQPEETPRKSRPTKAELEVLVTELKAALQTAQAEHETLQNQVVTLEKVIQKQKQPTPPQQDADPSQHLTQQISALKAALQEEQATHQRLKNELEQQGQELAALKLELNTAKQVILNLTRQSEPLPASVTPPTQTPQVLTRKPIFHQRPVTPTRAIDPSTLTDKEIGWFD